MTNLPEDPAQTRKTINLIIAAQITGMLAFAGLAAYLATRHEPAAAAGTYNMLLLGLVGVGVAEALVYVLVRNVMLTRWRETYAGQPNATETLKAARGRLSVAALLPVGLAEAFGLLGAVGVLVTGELLFLSAPVLAAALMSACFVTELGAQRFMQQLTGRFG